MLRAILWAKALISHLEAGGWSLAKTLFSVGRRKVDESVLLDLQKPLGRIQKMDGQRCRLEFFKRSRPTQTKRCLPAFDLSRVLILSCPVQAFNLAVNNPTAARAMTSIIQ